MKINRLIRNTAFVYFRYLLKLILGLWASRWVLNGLGHEDFGVYVTVGSVLIIVTFFNTILSGSVSRYISYDIGRGNSDEVLKWFNTALFSHFLLASFLLLFGWFLLSPLVAELINASEHNKEISLYIFRISLVALFFSMVSIPFVSMFIARQRMGEVSLWVSLESILSFFLAFSLNYYEGDRLLYYSGFMAAIIIVVQLIQVVRAVYVFQECRVDFKYWFCLWRLKKIVRFSFWNVIGSSGVLMRDHGSAILINIYHGSVVNSAYGISRQVSLNVGGLANSLLVSFEPEVVASEGRGDRKRVVDLSLRASRLGAIFILFFSIPLVLELDYVLDLWLINPPEYTSILILSVLFSFFVDKLTSGFMLAINANGKIAAYQATIGALQVSSIFFVWCLFEAGLEPGFIGVVFVAVTFLCSLGRIFWGKALLGVQYGLWFLKVFLPCLIVLLVPLFIGLCVRLNLESSFFRLLLVSLVTSVGIFSMVWMFALEVDEKKYIKALSAKYFREFLLSFKG